MSFNGVTQLPHWWLGQLQAFGSERTRKRPQVGDLIVVDATEGPAGRQIPGPGPFVSVRGAVAGRRGLYLRFPRPVRRGLDPDR